MGNANKDEPLAKLDIDMDLETFWEDVIREYQIEMLDIRKEHILNHSKLPEIHRDPFDRMLISQAQMESMTLVTKDHNIAKYNINTAW